MNKSRLLWLFWNLYSRVYDFLLSLLPYRKLLLDSVSFLPSAGPAGNLRVLDAGSGTGNLGLFIGNFGGSLFSADLSRSMLERASRKNLKALLVQTDLNYHLPFKSGSFDVVFSINNLYALSDPVSALAELNRVLKFGGRLILATPQANPKIRKILKEHFIMAKNRGRKFSDFFVLPKFAILILFNILIKLLAGKSARTFSFFEKEKLKDLVQWLGFEIRFSGLAYGDSDILIAADKVLNMVRRNIRYQGEICRTEYDYNRFYGLRYQIYCLEMKSLKAVDYPDEKESDSYDKHSVVILIKKEKELIGAMRLICSNGSKFLMEEEFVLPSWIDRKKAVEYSRSVIRREDRGRGIYKLLLKAAEIWQRENGFPVSICAATENQTYILLLKDGWQEIGEKKEYHNTNSYPMIKTLT